MYVCMYECLLECMCVYVGAWVDLPLLNGHLFWSEKETRRRHHSDAEVTRLIALEG